MSNPLCDAGRMKRRNAHLPVNPGCGNPSSQRMDRSQNETSQAVRKPLVRSACPVQPAGADCRSLSHTFDSLLGAARTQNGASCRGRLVLPAYDLCATFARPSYGPCTGGVRVLYDLSNPKKGPNTGKYG